jgi:hypothetical protein
MHHSNEKGRQMNRIEHSAEISCSATGVFGMLCALRRVSGGGVRFLRALVILAAAAGAVAFGASPALATFGPPSWRHPTLEVEVHSTRVAIAEGEENNGLTTEWKAEYITAQALEEAEKHKEAAKWVPVNSGTNFGGEGVEIRIGTKEPLGAGNGDFQLHHLAPETAYYARFVAKNADSPPEAIETIPFKTLPAAKPEIPQTQPPGPVPLFVGGADSDIKASFKAVIENNGADTGTEYSFEYAEHEAGPWKPFTSGGSGTVTAAEDYAEVQALLAGLKPETTYYVRIKASNEKGVTIQSTFVQGGGGVVSTFTTGTAKAVTTISPGSIRNVTANAAHVIGEVLPHGSETKWRFEYATSVLGPWNVVPGPEGAGTISQAQAEAVGYGRGFPFGARLNGLSPATTYYVRLFAENAVGEGEVCSVPSTALVCEPISGSTEHGLGVFATPSPPSARTFAVHGLQGESVQLFGGVNPDSTPTSAEQTITVEGAPTGGTFSLTFAGQSTGGTSPGTLTNGSPVVTGIALPAVKGTGNVSSPVCAQGGCQAGEVTGVTTSVGEFHAGEVISGPGIAPDTTILDVRGTKLTLNQATTESVQGAQLTSTEPSLFVDGEAVSGAGVPPGTTITEVRYEPDFTATVTLSANATASGVALTAGLPYNASNETVRDALENLPGEPGVIVEGPAGGPYTVLFVGPSGPGWAEKEQPQIEADGSGLTPGGTVKVQTVYKGGEGSEAHYRFQYVSEQSFGEHGWAGAEESPEMDAGLGIVLRVVNAVLPGLKAGETYRYRLLVSSSAGGALVEGSEQSLTVPTPPPSQPAGGCPNEAFRTGLSAKLPDCRAYELLTPVEKEGAQEPFKYGAGVGSSVFVGEGGEHVALEAPVVRWGAGPAAGGSPYFFSREAGKGWAIKAGSPQPETGVANALGTNQIYSADLSRLAFESKYETSSADESEKIEYKLGPAGGPYKTVASVPNLGKINGHQGSEGWVAANGGFSKLVLQTQDRTLLSEEPTGTRSGSDLYEYTPAGGLRQLNVSEVGGETVTIGSCGATVVKGLGVENGGAGEAGAVFDSVSGPHSVSADGSRVFFYASAPHQCASQGELESANNGTQALPAVNLYVRVNGSETVDIGAYKFVGANKEGTRLLLDGAGGLVSYDTETGTTEVESGGEQATAGELALLGIPAATEAGEGAQPFYHPRYTYWGGVTVRNGLNVDHEPEQAYRYDSVEHVVQCISCASPFDPAPKQPAFLNSGRYDNLNGGPVLGHTFTSANGEFAFFTTPAALVPQDVDGEIGIEVGVDCTGGLENCEYGDNGGTTSPSSDIYEWRAGGVDGCARVQGCLALITDGRGGYLNLLLGSADEGRDVFIYTRSELLPQDNDSSGDIYDARIEGGFAPPPPRPTECEASACSTPPSAPNDTTPSSLTFNGAGNLVQPAPGKPAAKAKKPKKKVKQAKKKARSKHKGKKARRAARDRRAR